MKQLPKTLLAVSMGLFVTTGIATVFQSASPAYAAEQKKEETKRETRHLQSLSQAVYDIINKANMALEAKMYDQAVAFANDVLKRKNLNDYEQVIAYQMRGYAEYYNNNSKPAIADFKKIIEIGDKSDGLPDGFVDGIKYNLATIYIQQSQYDQGIALLKTWMETAQNPGPEAYVLLAEAYGQKEDYKSAIPYYIKAMDIAKTQNKEIPRDWYQNLASMYLLTEQYKLAEPVLETLIQNWPTKQYLMNLANVYAMEKREKDMLGIVDALYRKGMLDKEPEIVQLSQLWQFHEAPYRGAVILKKGMDDGIVEKSAKNYESLANAYVAADEVSIAIPYLEKAASMAKDGNLYVRLAEAYIQDEKWDKATGALQSALNKGGVDNKNQANYLMGIAQYNMGKMNDAKRSFAECQNDKNLGKNCAQYLQVIRQKEQSKS
jgi:tetratricopeptide (TPR) repeat protein